MANYIVAMLFGLLSTILLHIAKAMERQGIEIFAQIRDKLRKAEAKPAVSTNITNMTANGQNAKSDPSKENVKKPTIYIIGLIMNNTVFLWMMLANMFAPPSYFTSMFGVGLIALMLYSTKVLKEEIKEIEYIGAGLLLSGTLVLGIEGIFRPELNMADVITNMVWLILGILFIVGIILIVFAYKTRSTLLIGIVFGLFGGSFGCMDPFFKGMGQSAGGTVGFLPVTPAGWVVFLASFGLGAAAFWLTQVGYMKQASASVLVPCYNSMYIVFPILVSYLALPGFTVSWVTFLGIGLTIVGIVLMQAFKPIKAPIHQ